TDAGEKATTSLPRAPRLTVSSVMGSANCRARGAARNPRNWSANDPRVVLEGQRRDSYARIAGNRVRLDPNLTSLNRQNANQNSCCDTTWKQNAVRPPRDRCSKYNFAEISGTAWQDSHTTTRRSSSYRN